MKLESQRPRTRWPLVRALLVYLFGVVLVFGSIAVVCSSHSMLDAYAAGVLLTAGACFAVLGIVLLEEVKR